MPPLYIKLSLSPHRLCLGVLALITLIFGISQGNAQVSGDSVISGALITVHQLLLDDEAAPIGPRANAGPNQSITTGALVTLDGSGSQGEEPLTFNWVFTTRPAGSNAALSNAHTSSPSFTADVNGSYIVRLTVQDNTGADDTDTVSVTSSTQGAQVDTFDGANPLLNTINNQSALPDITKTTGRYRANLTDNSNNRTLHYDTHQGRLDAALVSFPFEFIARNIGIGTQQDSQSAPPHSGNPYIFAGVQVHVTNLESRNSSHVVVGHRGSVGFTIEGKNTVGNTMSGSSSVNDNGPGTAPDGRADIRIVGNADRTLTVYWQEPNLTPDTVDDDWTLYGPTWDLDPDGSLPGDAPNYGEQVYVGLITYASGSTGVPFVGTCDSIEIIQ